MRVDKYLWSVRYYKTRSKATDAAKKGRIRVNGAVVKPARDVYAGDVIDLRKDQIEYKVEVIDLPDSRVGNKIVGLYRTDITPKENFEAKKLIALNQDYYRRKGEGRPTKKDRRDLSDLLNQDEEE
ncbi:ribosome-associated heat shock protein Hsp15 [Nonlabens dokdonensis]|uniref:Ribosome-associated heat shock protein Hsp15 n=2 Tax=Nonlabens dokdonensis TaxID=328515 RepID=A0ABX5PXR5_9FLAO|nr:RNA-binding S4 domain-containing protein [Nonlabens dokdonensis]AGC77529.1 putative ribosome-associated heat shock protein [Nonlabens dokdonensis DSW-6]PZX39916.1 ribosome-associated heat shock protein Hsp15 [Nonlabens dokdonensis]